MEISVDRIVLSGDSVSWKENMSDIERRNLCSALIYPEEKEKGGRVARRSIVGFIGRNRLKGGPKVLPRMTDNRTLNWIFFSQTA